MIVVCFFVDKKTMESDKSNLDILRNISRFLTK